MAQTGEMPISTAFGTWCRWRRLRWGAVALLAAVALVAGCSVVPAQSAGTLTAGVPSAATSGAGAGSAAELSAATAAVQPKSVAATTIEAPPVSGTPAIETPTPTAESAAGSADARAGCPGVRCLSIVVTGDVLLHPPLVEQAHADSPTGQGLDFGPMLAAEKPYVQAADLAICHLETPLAPPDGPFSGYPEFSVPPQVLPALVATGYDACSTASNHTLDQGTDGVNRTLDDLDAAGLAHDGSYRTAQDAHTPTIITTPHGRVGFISVAYGFNDGPPDLPWQVNTLDTDAIVAKARAARAAGADLVIVAVHAGTEYDTEPNTDQVNAARTLLASPDIDLVYGHHAHVVQPLQKIEGKWVIYGLGNNIAAQETPVDGTHRGLLVRVTFSQASTGTWTTSDIAWVPSLQDAAPPHRWCSLTAGMTCSSPAADAQALSDTMHAVNLYGADTDGAHPLDRP